MSDVTQITLEVDAETAQLYRNAPPAKRETLRLLVSRALRPSRPTLSELLDQSSAQARENGYGSEEELQLEAWLADNT